MDWAPEQQSDVTEYGYRRTSFFTVIDWMEMETKNGAHTYTHTIAHATPSNQNTKKKVAIIWTQDGMGQEMAYTLPQVQTWFISPFVSEFR